ncbi:MAG: MoaD/ThiS family protein [Thermoprotei archaeon]|nr:MAG: MoaD/ThiS family protein [Thermoprotei archaeon]
MKVTVRFLLWLKEKSGTNELTLEIKDGATIADVFEEIKRRINGLSKYLDNAFTNNSSISVIVNGQSVNNGSYVLKDGDVIELAPLVSGG